MVSLGGMSPEDFLGMQAMLLDARTWIEDVIKAMDDVRHAPDRGSDEASGIAREVLRIFGNPDDPRSNGRALYASDVHGLMRSAKVFLQNRGEESLEHPTPDGVPRRMRSAIISYLIRGVDPGGFLGAVLRNDLADAFSRADAENVGCMKHYAAFLYSVCPTNAQGGSVDAWIEARLTRPLTTTAIRFPRGWGRDIAEWNSKFVG